MAEKIVAIGACVADTLMRVPHYPREDSKLRATASKMAGGGPAATGLVAAARLGAECGFAGCVGQDSFGYYLKDTLEKCGVDTSALQFTDKASTTIAVVTVDQAGERHFSFLV